MTVNGRAMFVGPELEGQYGLVTGASSEIGVGLATVLELGAAGMTVVGTSTSEAGAASITHALAEKGYKGFGVVLNFLETSGKDELDGWMKDLETEVDDNFTVLVNNAGITKDGLSVTIDDEAWDQVVTVNLRGPNNLTTAAIGSGRKRGMRNAGFGSIIDVGSVIAHLISGGQTAYAATKAGREAYIRQVAAEWAPKNIRANTVVLGGFDTEMTRGLDGKRLQQIIDHTAMGRLGNPAEAAKIIRVLASPTISSFVTGATWSVTGGM